jgi:ABC-2 type transport system ATP-binding protein
MSIISAKEVKKKYKEKEVLKGVSFDIESGEIFGLLGSNGAGKSTITKIMLGLEEKTSGQITFYEGKKVNLKNKVSLVPQDTAFYQDFTVEQNMMFFASILGLKKKMKKERVDFLLDWLNLNDFRKTKSSFLSGGYQRLLNIAITLINDPEIIFLDEPTVGLDPKMRKMFWEKIEELKKNKKTIILTTHYMDEAEYLCDKIALLKKGELIAIGSPEQLIEKHGGIRVMILESKEEVIDSDIEKIKTALNQKSIMKKHKMIFIPLEQEHSLEKMLAITDWLIEKGYNIKSSTTKEPNLEDVFLNITGEKMKKEE